MSRKTDLAWVAGIVDGEGTIGIHMVPASKLKSYRNKNPRYDLRVVVAMTHALTIRRIKSILGGTVGMTISKKKKHRNCYYWVSTARRAETALRLLLPYLVTKKPQARLALHFRLSFYNLNLGYELRKTQLSYRQRAWQRMRLLNKRGVA